MGIHIGQDKFSDGKVWIITVNERWYAKCIENLNRMITPLLDHKFAIRIEPTDTGNFFIEINSKTSCRTEEVEGIFKKLFEMKQEGVANLNDRQGSCQHRFGYE